MATYLFTPLAGGVCMWLNLKDRPPERMQVALGTAAVVVVIFLLGLFTPENFPIRYINIGVAFAAHKWASTYDGGRFAMMAVEGRQQSWWRLLGVSLLCFFAYVAVLIPALLIAEPDLRTELQGLWADGLR